MRSIGIIVFVFSFLFAFNQESGQKKSYVKQLDHAIELIEDRDYKTAYNQLLELYQIDSTDAKMAYYLAYASYYCNRDKTIALPYFDKGKSFNGNAYYFMGLIYHKNEEFSKAIEAFESYKSLIFEEKIFSSIEVDHQIQKIETAKQLIGQFTKIKVENLGAEVNSAYPDYAPVLLANGNKMYFTSRRKGVSPDEKDPNNEYFEDIYYTERVNREWQKPSNLGAPINTKTHDATVSISKDEKTLYFYRTNLNLFGGDIYKCTMQDNNAWSEPTLFDSRINSKDGSENCISIHPNGKVIFFTSNREGGYGGKDIYWVQKLPDGTWSLPMNIGGMINTPYDEDGPFISPDGKTFYFSSKGHRNMGGYDLFKSTQDENGQWSAPENLSYPINSVADDIYLTTLNNEDFVFSSNRYGGHGFADLYRTNIPKAKNEYLIIKGRVLEDKSADAIPAKITIFNTKTNQLEGIYKSDRETGKFVMVLNPGEEYKMFVEAHMFHSFSDIIDLTQTISLKDVQKTIKLIEKESE